jgi:hypothetical protein
MRCDGREIEYACVHRCSEERNLAPDVHAAHCGARDLAGAGSGRQRSNVKILEVILAPYISQ